MEIHSSASMLKILLFLCISSSTILLQAQAETIKYCEKSANYVVKVSDVKILPDPVVRGEPFTFKISAYTPETIPSGDLVYEITYAGAEGAPAIFHHDLCEEAPCPLPAGDFTLVHTELLPSYTPLGTYNVKLTFNDHKDNQLTCIKFPFKIGSESSVSSI
ncbi:hypothetical protein HN51_049729 [Arachis hypogaea]|uniref:MD-2-related lipid-recognition domain-containing protein n=1 Tax=Arachis hypogaea TaxID=3818 RepID=A0A444YE33_ARAHY|nr:putative phosphatidylglycerol/phosphatidylinositol transfer protein DDB_G0282179 [Arachis ipaensis]XP_025666333.1 putative phosphatidylglycerol/phosphatidylinositol transfer protein DDB_G0282179 [Arachis hypogaea]QHN91335.1 Putative phosphatidylglycerol/phosphatidylinositol transfer protein [Arachis hypogaea]RYR00194.1 hypothetical protein Ahy_B07g088295 [Arachis hypogaea]